MADAISMQRRRAQAVDAYKKSGQNDVLTYPEGKSDAVTITDNDMDGLQPGQYLSNNVIDFYIKYLQTTKLSSTDRDRFYFFNSFFFSKLLESSSASDKVDFGQLRKWTHGVDLFEKDYVFIPVIHRSHWSLILICHLTSLKQCRDEESKPPPCIYHLDSIGGRHESFEGKMKSYLFEAWMDGRDEIKRDQFHQMRALTCMKYIEAKVPQQDNEHDCGIYLLQYVEDILDDELSASNKFGWGLNGSETYFAKWNTSEVYEKRMSIKKLILKMSGVQEITLYLKPCKSQGISKQSNYGDLEIKEITFVHKLMKNIVPIKEESQEVVEVEAQPDIKMEGGEHYNNEMELDFFNSHPKDDTNMEYEEHGRDKELDLRSRTRIEDLDHTTTSANAFNSEDNEQLHDIVSLQSHMNENRRSWKWTREATQVLLECMVKGDLFYNESKKATNWNTISLEILKRSMERPSEKQCRLRYDTLLKSYKVTKDFCEKNGKSFGEITNMERKELRLSTTLCEEWYNMIERITNNMCHDRRPLKRRKLSASIENDPPIAIEKLMIPMVHDDIVEGQLTMEHLAKLSRLSEARMHDGEERRLRLRFENKLAQPIYSEDTLTSENCKNLIVNLEDFHTGEIVRTGPWASAELEVVVLKPGLTSDIEGNWTQQEFEKHISCKRDNLYGEFDIKLTDGKGLLGKLYFNDLFHSATMELGVRVNPSIRAGFRIQEARTKAFEVLPSFNKYIYPPTLGSEVWTLQHITKLGNDHNVYMKMGIFTVEEYLQEKAMGVALPILEWEQTWKHAMRCKPSGKARRYERDGIGIIFNHLFQAIGVMEERNGPFRDLRSLSEKEKKLIEQLIPDILSEWEHEELDEDLIPWPRMPTTFVDRFINLSWPKEVYLARKIVRKWKHFIQKKRAVSNSGTRAASVLHPVVLGGVDLERIMCMF